MGEKADSSWAIKSPKGSKEGGCVKTLNPGRPSVPSKDPQGKMWGPDAVGEVTGHREILQGKQVEFHKLRTHRHPQRLGVCLKLGQQN